MQPRSDAVSVKYCLVGTNDVITSVYLNTYAAVKWLVRIDKAKITYDLVFNLGIKRIFIGKKCKNSN